MLTHLYLIRHGETEWSLAGQHTSRTDVPLTEKGEQNARQLAERLSSVRFTEVCTSPRLRARQTCELAGFGTRNKEEADLAEWEYGDYEGLRSSEIQHLRPGWNIFRDGCPNGESTTQVSARADRLIARLRTLEGKAALFSHGHFCRVLAARWTGAPLEDGRRLLLSPASISILAYEHDNLEEPVITLWNETR
jgi:probable phosphoglycerate mutase